MRAAARSTPEPDFASPAARSSSHLRRLGAHHVDELPRVRHPGCAGRPFLHRVWRGLGSGFADPADRPGPLLSGPRRRPSRQLRHGQGKRGVRRPAQDRSHRRAAGAPSLGHGRDRVLLSDPVDVGPRWRVRRPAPVANDGPADRENSASASPSATTSPSASPSGESTPTVECWDRAVVAKADQCSLPTGEAGLQWVFPSFHPAECLERPPATARNRVTVWVCEITGPNGRSGVDALQRVQER